MTANANADGTAASGMTVTVLLPTADASGTTRAYVGQAVTIGAIDGRHRRATSDLVADANSTATDFGVVTVTVVSADAFVSGTVDAHVGSAAGTARRARGVADLNLSGALDDRRRRRR